MQLPFLCFFSSVNLIKEGDGDEYSIAVSLFVDNLIEFDKY